MTAGIVTSKSLFPDPKALSTLTHNELWLKKFVEEAPCLELPTDRPRLQVNHSARGMEAVVLDSGRYARLVEASPKLGGTLFTTSLALFATLLHRITGQDELVIGIPSNSQIQALHDDLVDHCKSFLPLHLQVDGTVSFKVFAAVVNERILQAYDQQDDTSGSLIEKCSVPRSTRRLSAGNAMFNMSKSGIDPVHLDGVKFDTSTTSNSFGNFDLFLNLILSNEELIVECEYHTELYDKTTIRGWLSAFEQLIESAITSGDSTLNELPMLGAEEARLMLDEWNATTREYPREASVHQLISDVAALSPERIAVRCGKQFLTYSDLESQSTSLAARLQAAGVKRSDLVGIHLERSCSMVIGLLAILKCGAAYVPLDPAFPAERLRFMVEDACMTVILSQHSVNLGLPKSNARVILLDESSNLMRNFIPMDFHPEDTAYVIFTSGSTGRPKGVRIPHRALVNFLNSMRREPGFAVDDVLLSVTTLSFDISGLEIFLPLITGAETIIATREVMLDGQLLADAIIRNKVTVLQATPSTWRLLLEAEWSGKSDLKILIGGEAVPRELTNQLVPLCKEIWNMYGPTETTIWSTISRLGSGENPISIGRPIDNTQVYIVNSSMQPQPIGVAGELLIGGDGLASGYHQLPELTADRFVDSPFRIGQKLYRTGDLARWTKDGSLECLGRMDHQVKVRGYRIELGEIESLMEKHPAVEQAVANIHDGKIVVYFRTKAPSPDSFCNTSKGRVDSNSINQNEILDWKKGGLRHDQTANVNLSQRSDSDSGHMVSSLRNHLAAHLPDYMIPCAFVRLERFPLTPSGKIDRKALPAPFEEGSAEAPREVVPARNRIEAKLLNIWKQVLEHENIGIEDDIFALGCDSISVFQITSRATRAGIVVTPAQVFQYRTVAALASNCRYDTNHSIEKSIQPVNRDHYRRRL